MRISSVPLFLFCAHHFCGYAMRIHKTMKAEICVWLRIATSGTRVSECKYTLQGIPLHKAFYIGFEEKLQTRVYHLMGPASSFIESAMVTAIKTEFSVLFLCYCEAQFRQLTFKLAAWGIRCGQDVWRMFLLIHIVPEQDSIRSGPISLGDHFNIFTLAPTVKSDPT